MRAGTDSHQRLQPAQANRARLVRAGVDVTGTEIQNPAGSNPRGPAAPGVFSFAPAGANPLPCTAPRPRPVPEIRSALPEPARGRDRCARHPPMTPESYHFGTRLAVR